jgi:hypothetical protein
VLKAAGVTANTVGANDDEDDGSAESLSAAVEAGGPTGSQELLSNTRAAALVTMTAHFLAT